MSTTIRNYSIDYTFLKHGGCRSKGWTTLQAVSPEVAAEKFRRYRAAASQYRDYRIVNIKED